MKINNKTLHNIHIKLYEFNKKKRLNQFKECCYCGNTYQTTIHHSKYCSDTCRSKANNDNNNKRVRRYRHKHQKLQVGTSNISQKARQDPLIEEQIIKKEKNRLLR